MIVIATFLMCLAGFTLIGVMSAFQKKDTTEDYLVAGRSVNPWLTALSAVATNNSGFMFIGMIGYTYRDGIESIWMMVGWVVGDLLVWLFIYRRVREYSAEVKANSAPTFIGVRGKGASRPIVILAGLITFFFLGAYAAAQLQAGSTALYSLFDWPMWLGAVLGAGIVVAYCFSGGLRASIWTDAAQSAVMLISMAVLLIVAAIKIGGPIALFAKLKAIDPQLLTIFPQNLKFGFPLFLLGMTAGGFGAVGQPHILIRMMAINSAREISRARWIYFMWYIPFFIGAIAVGLYARALIPFEDLLGKIQPGLVPTHAADEVLARASETALPELAILLLPDVLIGLTLAGLFSATMSTADSQILSCSAALTQDVAPKWRDSYVASKIATLSVAALALGIALFAQEGVFALVLIAWSAMGASLGPLVVLQVMRRPVPTWLAISMMAAAIGTVIGWNYSGYDGDIFKLLPGLVAAFAVYFIGSIGGRLIDLATAKIFSNQSLDVKEEPL